MKYVSMVQALKLRANSLQPGAHNDANSRKEELGHKQPHKIAHGRPVTILISLTHTCTNTQIVNLMKNNSLYCPLFAINSCRVL